MKVAIIGLGYFSQFHIDAWQSCDGVEIVGAVDPDPERRKWAEETFGLIAFANISTLKSNGPADVVDVISPPETHLDVMRDLADYAPHVICQKPFCRDTNEARQAIQQAGKTHINIHENFRFQPWYRGVKALLDANGLGQVYQCRFALRPGDGRGPDAYLNRQPSFQTMPYFLIRETGVHFVDLFRWMFGEVSHVQADLYQLNPVLQGEDAGMFVLKHTSGVRCIFDGNRHADHATDNPRRTMGELTIEGEKGTLLVNGLGQIMFREFGSESFQEIPLSAAIDDGSFGGGCVGHTIRHIVEALNTGQQPENSARDYLPNLEIVDAIYLSNSAGRRVSMDK